MKITPFAIAGLLGGIFSLGFGLLVLIKGANKKLARIWGVFSFSAAAWGFGGWWIGTASTPESALWAWRFAYGFGVVWIPTFFFQFVCTFCELKRPKTILLHYIFSGIYFVIMPTNYFFGYPHLMFDSLYFPSHSWPYVLFVGWWLLFVIYSHAELWNAYRKGDALKKGQIKYFFLGTAVGYCGGSLVYFPNFGIELYPWGNFTLFLYPLIMSYAIIKFNLMDIRILVRRTALIISLYLLLLLASAPVLYFFHLPLPVATILVSIILSMGPFLYAYVVRRNSYFQEYTLAGLTHELKSPLAVIDSALDFLNNTPDLSKLDKAQLSAYLQMIERNSSRLRFFVNDLLHAFNQPHAGAKISPVRVDLTAITRRVYAAYTALATSKGLNLKLNVPTTALFIVADEFKIEQALSNILSNAIKFTDAGMIQIDCRQSATDVTVSITDNGCGIPPDELPYIFDRFYQGQQGRKKKGTGIGLTIAKLWVEAHGGRIWVEEKGRQRGATIIFNLPN